MTTHLAVETFGLYAMSLGLYIWYLYVNKRLIGRAATLSLEIGRAHV